MSAPPSPPGVVPADRLAEERNRLAARSADARFAAALAAIDEANAADPNVIDAGEGVQVAKELAHAQLMCGWVLRLDPSASDLQVLAARAHHLRRWSIARDSYDEGRSGYLRWRAALKKQHAVEVGEILERCGYGADEIDRVQRIVRKEGISRDAQVQTHEDALCLTFVQSQQFAELAGRLADDKIVAIVRKTLGKMSEQGIAAALALPLSDAERDLIARATVPANDEPAESEAAGG